MFFGWHSNMGFYLQKDYLRPYQFDDFMFRKPNQLIFYVSGTQSGKVIIPDCILGCLPSATFGELLELAGLLTDAIILRAEVATSSSFHDAKAVSLETPVSVCQCKGFFFIPTYRPRLGCPSARTTENQIGIA